jgi:hypothetical protein
MSVDYRLGPVSEKAFQEIVAQGLDLPEKPVSGLPKLPDSLTNMSDVELMESYAEFVAWSDYTTSQVAAAAIDERAAQANLDAKEAEVMLREWTGKTGDRVTLQKAKAAADPEIIEARKAVDERYAYRKLAESIATAMERNAQMLSRELTRRTSFEKTTTRGRHL